MLDEFGAIAAGAGARVATGLLPMLNMLAGDLLKTAEGAEDVGNSFSPLTETFRALVILGGNVAFVFKTIGNDIGGIAASVASLLTLDFGAVKNIDKMMKEDATSGRAAFDAWEKRWLEVGKTAKKVEAEVQASSQAERDAAAAQAAAFLKDAELKAAAEKKVAEAAAQAKRIAAEAKREREAAAKKAAQESAAAIKRAKDFIETLKIEASQAGLGSDQLKMMAAAREAAVAPTAALRMEIMEEALARDIATKAATAQADADKVLADAKASSISEVAAINEETAALLVKIQTHRMLPEEITRAKVAELEAAQQSSVLTAEGIAEIQLRIDALKGLATAQAGAGALGEAPGLTQAKELLEVMAELDEATKSAAAGMAASFGKVGAAIGGLTTALSGYGRAQAAIAAQLQAVKDNKANSPEAVAKAEIAASKQSAQAQIKSYGDMASAAKGFFKESSSGYKVMEKAEKAFRATEMAMAIESMLTKSGLLAAFTAMFVSSKATEAAADSASTTSSIANSMLRAGASLVEGVSKAFAQMGVWGFVGAAAIIAFMGAMGVFGGTGGGGPAPGTFEGRQKTQGTGTVLGDDSAKSESISRSIDIMEKNSSLELGYQNSMLVALRNIESALGGAAKGIFQTAGLTSGSAFGTKNESTKSFFGSDKSTTITDSGIRFTGSLGDLRAGGGGATQYEDVTKTSDGGWFRGNKTNSWTNTKALADAAMKPFTLIFDNMGDLLVGAGVKLGADSVGLTNAINQIGIDFAVSTRELKGQDLVDALSAGVSVAFDKVTTAVFPQVAEFQKVGEGMGETLVRLASNYAALDSTLGSIGMTFGATGMASLAARQDLIDLAGGIDALSEQTSGFATSFLTEAQRLAPVQKHVTEQMAALGYAGVTTREQFANVVLGLNLSTEAGAKTFTGLMAVQDAFAQVYAATEEVGMSEQALADKRKDLRAQLDQLTLSEEQLLEKQKVGMDAVTRSLFDSVTAAQAAKDANDKISASMTSYKDQIAALENAGKTLEQRRADEIKSLDATVAPLARQLHAMQDQASAAKEAATALEAAAATARGIATERAGLEKEMMQLQGDTAGLRKLELDALNPTNRAIKEAIFALQDKNAADALAAKAAAEAAKLAQDAAKAQQDAADQAQRAAEQVRSAYQAVTDTIFDEVARIRGLLNENTADSVADAQAAFAIKTAQARAGDQEAAKLLPQLSKSLLDLSEANALTALDRDRVRAQTMGSLIDTGNILTRMFGLDAPGLAASIGASVPVPNAPVQPYVQQVNRQGADTSMLEAAVDRLTTQVANQQAALNRIASTTQRSADTLDRLSDGGVAVRTKEVAA